MMFMFEMCKVIFFIIIIIDIKVCIIVIISVVINVPTQVISRKSYSSE